MATGGAAIPALALAVGRRYFPGPPRDSLNRDSNTAFANWDWPGLDENRKECERGGDQ
jgi:hypothetical protein